MFTLSLLFAVWVAWVYAVGVVFVDLRVRAIVVFLIMIFYGLVVGASVCWLELVVWLVVFGV